MRLELALAVVVAGFGCVDPVEHADAGVDAGVEVDALFSLDDEADFDAVKGAEGAAKYLGPVAGTPETPPITVCQFQNTARFPFHVPYLNSLPGGEDLGFNDYVENVMRRPNRRWWGGEVLWRASSTHPLTGDTGVMVFGLYTEDSPGNRLAQDDVVAVFTLLQSCAPGFKDHLAFGPSTPEQRTAAAAFAPALEALGIAVVD